MLGYSDKRLRLINYVEKLSASLGIPSIDYEDGVVIYSLLYSYLSKTPKCSFVVDAGSGIGYSTLWLTYAVLDYGAQDVCKIVSIEMVDYFVRKSIEILRNSGINEFVKVIKGDACEVLKSYPPIIDYLFLDVDNRDYIRCISSCINRIVKGGYIVAHNAYFPYQEYSREFIKYLKDNGFQVTVIPTRMGLVLAIKNE